MSLDGMIHCKIIEGSYDTAQFAEFILELVGHMQPFPAPRSVIVMDNCRIHKAPEIMEIIRALCVNLDIKLCSTDMSRHSGMRAEFLPPYSPDFNPIELAFSVIKQRIRRDANIFAGLLTHADDIGIYDQLFRTVYSITSHVAYNFFHHCRYI